MEELKTNLESGQPKMEIDRGIYRNIETDPDYAAAYFEELATRPRAVRVSLLQKLFREDNRKLVQTMQSWKRQKTKHPAGVTQLILVALEMKEKGFPTDFIGSAVDTAIEFEGVADLMNLWINETDPKERSAIIGEIRDMIKECAIENPSRSRQLEN